MSHHRDSDGALDYEREAMDRSSVTTFDLIVVALGVVVLVLSIGTGRDGTQSAGNKLSPPSMTSSTRSTTGSGSRHPPTATPAPDYRTLR